MTYIRKAHMLLFTVLITVFLAACDNPIQEAHKQKFRAPFDVAKIRESVEAPYTKKFQCKTPPAPIKRMFYYSMYDKSSKNASIVDPEAEYEYKKAVKPLQQFESGLAVTANKYVESRPARSEIAACVMSWISIWADAKAMLGESNATGDFLRKWLLSSISLAYIQVKDDPYISPKEHEKAKTWLKRLAQRVKSDFSKNPDVSSRNNNHMYWAAWGVMTAAVVLDDQTLFDWALYELKVGIEDIDENGTLPLEIARGPKAYHYHHFAATPLFLMAHTAYLNNVDVYERNNRGLKRLARVILENMEDQSFFEELTQEKQNMKRTITESSLVWLELYYKKYHDPEAIKWLNTYRPIKHSRSGGSATLLYSDKL